MNEKEKTIGTFITYGYALFKAEPTLGVIIKKPKTVGHDNFRFGAEDGIRTRDFHLGKVTLYH